MKRIISFSLYGAKPMYTVGALANVRLSKSIYCGWICRFYVDGSVPREVVEALRNEGAEIVDKSNEDSSRGMFWRFEPVIDSEVERFIVRDVDARLTLRERSAVDEWVTSGKSFHVLRDHPNHKYVVMGGMWGALGGSIPDYQALYESYAQANSIGFWSDMQFISACLWDKYICTDHISHDEYWRPTGLERKFPTALEHPGWFVGNKFDDSGKPVYDLIRDYSDSRFICNNLGLGDHLICNGLILHIQREFNGHVYIFSKRHNASSVVFMFRDVPNIHVIQVDSDENVHDIIDEYPSSKKILTGVYKDNFRTIPDKGFDEIFYMQAGIPFDVRWNGFHIERDSQEEERVFNTYDVHEPYSFVHDDPIRGYGIRENLVSPLKIVRPKPGLSHLFSYMKLIENAAQIDVIDSSFMFLIDSMPSLGKKLVLHRYARAQDMVPFNTPSLRRDWRVIV